MPVEEAAECDPTTVTAATSQNDAGCLLALYHPGYDLTLSNKQQLVDLSHPPVYLSSKLL